jgi:PAS domain S-box-containing protein
MRERKKIEQELRDSEKKFRELVELLPEGVYETDKDGYITFVNGAGLKMMGYTQNDIDSKILISEMAAPEERGLAIENMKNRFINNLSEGYQYNARKKDGTIFPVYIHAVPIFKDGKSIGTRGVCIDVTVQKKYEEELIEIAEELKQINASKDKFFSIVAHDLRNPFTSVLGFTEILLGGYNTFTREEIRAYAEHIRKSARNTYNLLDNLLQWGRIQTNKIECSPVKLNLHNRVDKVLNLLRPSAENKEINIIDRTKENTFVKADKHMFQSVLQNLVTNAIKFTNRKGTIEITVEETDKIYKISVIDNGVGISKEILETLFCIDSPNTRAGTEKESGTGLGLIICKDMMEKMSGTIEVESEPNKGSKFTITLNKWKDDTISN